MRFIVIDKSDKKVKSIAELPFEYKYPVQEDYELVTGYEDYVFNLMSNDYFFSDENFIEVSRV